MDPRETPMTAPASTPTPIAIPLPPDSLIARVFPRIDYADAFSSPLRAPGASLDDAFKAFFRSAPAWLMGLMDLRDRAARIIGLKTSQGGSAANRERALKEMRIEPGVSVGIFHIHGRSGNEVLAGEDDKHLDFRASVLLGETRPDGTRELAVATVVRIHNLLGRVYFGVVRPIHRFIVPVMIKAMVRNLERDAANASAPAGAKAAPAETL